MNDDQGRAVAAGATAPEFPLPLRFVGSGSEYFRIWAVNLLLTLVTLGLYYPYAKLRRLRYFFGATEVGGQPLSFHARGRSMYVGYGLVAVLTGVYSLAGRLSPAAGAAAFAIVALLWPALWHSALRFRLFNTGWRGLRFGFAGTRGGAYLALWPVLALVAAGLVAAALLPGLAAVPASVPQPEAGRSADAGQGSPAQVLLALLPAFVMLVVLPAVLWRMRRYQHGHFQLAGERTEFLVPLRAFYALALRTFGLGIAVGLLVLAAMAALVFGGLLSGDTDTPEQRLRMVGRGVLAGFAALFIVQVLLRPYITSRLQNLVWNGTRSQHLRFGSSLRMRPLVWLTLKNWLLMIVTLGLYYPFAAVAVARMRLQAVTVVSALDPDAFVAGAGPATEAAAGDAAGDLFGLDIGL